MHPDRALNAKALNALAVVIIASKLNSLKGIEIMLQRKIYQNTKNWQQYTMKVPFLVAIVASLVFFTTTSVAQIPSILYEDGISSGGDCGSCCAHFTFTVGTANQDDIELILHSSAGAGSDNCWNWDCVASTITISPNTNSVTVTGALRTGLGKYRITFSGTLAPNDVVTFILCPNEVSCAYAWDTYDWESYSGGPPPILGTRVDHDEDLPLAPCVTHGDLSGCINCDSVIVRDGANCFVDICFYLGGNTPSGKVEFDFSPPLHMDNLGQAQVDGCDAPWNDFQAPLGWSLYSSTSSALVFTANNIPSWFKPCHEYCFTIPKSVMVEAHTITAHAQSPGNVNTPCTTPVSATFKRSAQHDASNIGSSSANFPNPLSKDNEFKTMIPFILQNAGEAYLRVFEQSGKEVISESMEFGSAGKHFFFLTGTELSSGTYFYTIEAPKGLILEQHKLLIVK